MWVYNVPTYEYGRERRTLGGWVDSPIQVRNLDRPFPNLFGTYEPFTFGVGKCDPTFVRWPCG